MELKRFVQRICSDYLDAKFFVIQPPWPLALSVAAWCFWFMKRHRIHWWPDHGGSFWWLRRLEQGNHILEFLKRTCQLIAMKPRLSELRTTSCTWIAPGMFLPSFRQLQTRLQNSVKHPLRFLHALKPIYGDSTCIRFFVEDTFVFHVHWLIYLGYCRTKSSTPENLWPADRALNMLERFISTEVNLGRNPNFSRDMRPPTLENGFWNSSLLLIPDSVSPGTFWPFVCRIYLNFIHHTVHLILVIANMATSQYGRARHGGGTVGCHMSLTPAQWRKPHPCRCPSTWMSHPAWSLRHAV